MACHALNRRVLAVLFFSWVFLGTAAYCRSPESLGLAIQQVEANLQFAALSDSLVNLSELECVPRQSLNHVRVFHEVSVQSATTFNKNYSNYVSVVTKPMQGNGKCDGGFNSVAQESRNREKATSELENNTYQLQVYFMQNFQGHFQGVPIFFADDSEELKCQRKGGRLYDEAEASGLLANGAITKFRMGAIVTEKAFASYAGKNTNLANDCGRVPGDLTSLVGGIIYQQPPGPGGKFPLDPSRITGKINGLDLSSGDSLQISRPAFPDPENPGASDVTGPSGGAFSASATGSSQSRSDGSAQRRRAMFKTLEEFGKKTTTTDGRPQLASEEIEVERLLKGGATGGSGQERSPAGAAGMGQGVSVVESAILARGVESRASGDRREAGEGAMQKGSSAELGNPGVSLFERIHLVLRGGRLR